MRGLGEPAALFGLAAVASVCTLCVVVVALDVVIDEVFSSRCRRSMDGEKGGGNSGGDEGGKGGRVPGCRDEQA
eukprot:682764-Pleurochrysis_carterae.AAC.2